MADDYGSILAHEFSAGEGSFLLQLRVHLTWDKAAFTCLTQAMLSCCQAYDALAPLAGRGLLVRRTIRAGLDDAPGVAGEASSGAGLLRRSLRAAVHARRVVLHRG